MHHLEHWISSYGYFGIFSFLFLGIIGLPIPDETLLVFSGYLVFRGTLHPLLTFLAGVLGSGCGISVSYGLGRLLGRRVISHYGKYIGITSERLEKAHDWYRRIGRWTLAVGYFVPGIRHLTAIAAGISELESTIFMAYAYPGAVLWVSSFLCMGYFFGEDWRFVVRVLHENMVLALALAVGSVLLVVAGYFLKKSSRG